MGIVPSDYSVRLLSVLHRLRLTKEVTQIITKPFSHRHRLESCFVPGSMAWIRQEIIFLTILTAKPRKIFLIHIYLATPCSLRPSGGWRGVLESKRLDSKLLQSGLMREERRPATGRNVGALETLQSSQNGNFSTATCRKENASAQQQLKQPNYHL